MKVQITIPTDIPDVEFCLKKTENGTCFAYLEKGNQKISITGEIRSWINSKAANFKEIYQCKI